MSVLTIYSTTDDGYVSSLHASTYSTARSGSGSTLTAFTSDTTVIMGQSYVTPYGGYTCYEAFLGFDTSILPDTASISTAVLSLYGQTDSSATDFTIEARLRDWGSTVETGDYVAGASLSALTSLATFATSGFSASGYNAFTNVAMPANVNKTGYTRIICYSSRHSGNNTPTGLEYVVVYSGDQSGTSNDPKLVITYLVDIKKVATVPIDEINKVAGLTIAGAV
jgi:uncharacterized membrane protein